MKAIKKLSLIALFFYLPLQSMAWGQLGHRIVAQIADSYLTPKARVELQKILGNESLAMASTWADFIKSDPAYSYLSPWHYLDFAPNQNHEQVMAYLKTDTVADAYTKLNFMIGELKKKDLPQDKKLMYVRLIIHIVGDIHQPFHAGRAEDQGGNKIQVMWAGQQTNLHSLWDSKLIDDQQFSYTEYANNLNHTTAEQRAELDKGGIGEWIYQSNQIAEQLYNELKDPNPKLSYRYTFDHIHIVNEQLLKGGVRLAYVLNGIFGA